MTGDRHPLTELLADAVADPPVTSVTAARTYRRGRRRRATVRAVTACAVVAVLAGSGVVAAQFRPTPDGVAPQRMLEPLPATPTRCADLAAAVRTVAAAALPAEIEWTGTRLPERAADCTGGGLFWVTFDYRGRSHTLGFEGGESADGKPCDPERRVTRCDEGGAHQVGHYREADDYGVLYGRAGLFFFLGLESGADAPLTTDQLAMTAEEIARVVYGD